MRKERRRAVGPGIAGSLAAVLWMSVSIPPAGITDALTHAPPDAGPYAFTTFVPPAPGASYIDPVFGTTIRRLTADDQDDDLYGRNMWWNADATKYFHKGKIIDTTTGHVTHTVPVGSSSGDAGFDPVDPNVCYYYSGMTIHRVVLGARGTTTDTVWLTAPATINGLGGSENWLDASGRLLVVSYGAEPSVHVFDTQNLAAGAFTGAVPSASSSAYTMLTPSGRHVITPTSGGAFNAADAFKSYRVDLASRTLGTTATTFWTLCGDHAGYLSASDGHDYMIAWDCYNTYDLYRVEVTNDVAGFADERQHAAPGNRLLWSHPPNGHLTAIARGAQRDWAFLSTEEHASPWVAFQEEIVGINVITGERRRLAHHRSNITNDYYTGPRVSASWGGELIGWASNYQHSSRDIYAMTFAGPGGDAVRR